MTATFWNERFSQDTYVYGEAPNTFVADQAHLLPSGSRVLSLGEGEGRNATYLAAQGAVVTALDSSAAGFEKLRRLAEQRGVAVEAILGDVTTHDLGTERWDAILNIYCHLPSSARGPLYEAIRRALKPGGLFMTEQFSPEQLAYQSGGPKDPDMLMTLAELSSAFEGWEVLVAREEVIHLDEGPFHQGAAAVTRFIARKP
ncbi:class I SAM-dependent methyltransferase [bacterium]|nr:class I SAM-dependent methyltransferase [bacterium]